MKLGIIGLPQTGKKTLFATLTGSLPAGETKKTITGIADIRDERFNILTEHYMPKKTGPARIDIEVLPAIEPGSSIESDLFSGIASVDALCHVVRAFTDESVYHAKGSVNPGRDIEIINSELILHDLIFIEKRFERIEKNRKKSGEKNEAETKLLQRFKDELESGNELRNVLISDEEHKLISGYPLLTLKKMLIVLNIDDSHITSDEIIAPLTEKFSGKNINIIQIAVKLESEIASFEAEEDRLEFMKESGIEKPALENLSRLAMKSLGLISFFTVGKDEVKQWLVKNGVTAPEAAGTIHSDIQRGFIRAEIFEYSDLLDLGNEDALKKAGKIYLMGKDYTVKDGDIISFRFNV